jgi:hypothetical protein
VEFGVNEVLGARSGLLAPGLTVVPTASWRPTYDQLIAGVKTAGAKVLLVGLLTGVENFPSLRRGAELYEDRAELAEFGVVVSDDCGAGGSESYVYVPAKVVGAYAAAKAAKAAQAAGRPAPALSCADVPGTQDYVLTAADMAALNVQLGDMNEHVREVAAENGFAFFDLDPLYGRRGLKAPFGATALLTSDEPYGPYISLDGVHPSAAGHRILAREAAKALNVTYHLAVPHGEGLLANRSRERDERSGGVSGNGSAAHARSAAAEWPRAGRAAARGRCARSSRPSMLALRYVRWEHARASLPRDSCP